METVLVVDDDALIREIVKDTLTAASYKVFMAKDFLECIDVLRREKINVVLLDLVLPSGSGIELIPRINEVSPDSVVVMMTAYASVDSAIDSIRKGAYDFIRKPLKTEELLHTIRKASERQALLVENRALLERLEERLTRLELFKKVSEVVSSTLDLPELLDRVMQVMKAVIGAEACSVLLQDKPTGDLVFTVALGKQGEEVKKFRIKPGQGIAGWVFEHRESLLIRDAKKDERFYQKVDEKTGFETRSVIAVPLIVKDRILGVIQVINKVNGGYFEAEDRDLLVTMSGQIAVAIENAEMTDNLKRSLDAQSAINRLLRIMLEDLPLDEIIGRLLNEITSLPWLSIQSRGGIWLVEEPNTLVLRTHRGLPVELQSLCAYVPFGRCICGRAARSGIVEFTSSVDKGHELGYEGMPPHGHYCIPIKSSGKVLGVMNLYLNEGHQRDAREEGFLTSVADIVSGIVQRRQAEDALRENEEKFYKISSSAQDAIIMMDGKGKVSYWNPASERIFGFTNEDAVGKDLHELIIPPIHSKAFLRGFERFRNTGEGVVLGRTMFLPAVKKDGTEFPVEVSISAVKIEKEWNAIGILRDITERKRFEETVREMAYHDNITGLPNRMLLIDRFNQVIARGRRLKLLAALFFIDLDRFKVVNDTLGHAIGDELLKAVAERLKKCIRESDTVARIGDDEFTILVQDIKNVEDVIKVAEKVFSVFNEPFNLKGHELFVTTSMGVSIYPNDGADAATLFKNADIAMYRAKGEGRSNFQLYAPEMNIKAMERLGLENKLRKAIEKGELTLHYQPQVDLSTGEVIGVEALVRWDDPERRLVLPGEFIPLAEETGFIIPIGEWVLRTACMQTKAWQLKGCKPIHMAINLSLRQFKQKDFVNTVVRILKETGIDQAHLELELTESIVMENVDSTIEILHKLKSLGIRLTIDDFGTGYSSLQYLKRMPIDMVKIDQSFVRDITVDPDDTAISTAIISVAHSLNIEVIAEGVETIEQLKLLRTLQCDKIQGSLVSKPVPTKDVEWFLTKDRRFFVECEV